MRRLTPLLVIITVLLPVFSSAATVRVLRPKQQVRVVTPRPNNQRTTTWWGPPPSRPNAPVQGPKAAGVVQAVGQNSVTLKTPSGFNTYIVGTGTQIVVQGKPAGLGDVVVGWRANVTFEYTQNLTTTARKLSVVKPEPYGRITAMSPGAITITDNDQAAWDVAVTQETKVQYGRFPFTLDDLRIGYWARAEGPTDGRNVQAMIIRFQPMSVKGVITDVTGDSFRIKTVQQQVIDGVTSDRTIVTIHPRTGPNYPGTRADIRPGMAANAGGFVSEGRPMEVISVEILIAQ